MDRKSSLRWASAAARLGFAALLALLGFAAVTAQAQNPTAGAVAAARELIQAKGGGAMFEPVIPGVVESTKNTLVPTNPNLTRELNEPLERCVDRVRRRIGVNDDVGVRRRHRRRCGELVRHAARRGGIIKISQPAASNLKFRTRKGGCCISAAHSGDLREPDVFVDHRLAGVLAYRIIGDKDRRWLRA